MPGPNSTRPSLSLETHRHFSQSHGAVHMMWPFQIIPHNLHFTAIISSFFKPNYLAWLSIIFITVFSTCSVEFIIFNFCSFISNNMIQIIFYEFHSYFLSMQSLKISSKQDIKCIVLLKPNQMSAYPVAPASDITRTRRVRYFYNKLINNINTVKINGFEVRFKFDLDCRFFRP